MAETTICPLILSGGAGSRLWPLSRQAYPKQFIDLLDGPTLFQSTALRVASPGFSAPIVIANAEHRFIAAEQLQSIGVASSRIILEPVARNTGPAVLVGAYAAAAHAPGQPLLVLPSDHRIADPDAFLSAVTEGLPAAMAGRIVTFGITPTHPHTGYGYIQLRPGEDPVRDVAAFVEKPDVARAAALLAGGDHVWNAGIFLALPETLIAAAERHAPQLLEPSREAFRLAAADLDFLRLDATAFEAAPSISVDHAIMEHAAGMACVSAACGWSDLGSWASVADAAATVDSREGNSARGDATFLRARNCHVHATPGLSVSLLGLDDVIAVATPDAVLVAARSEAEGVRDIVALRRASGDRSIDTHARAYRPWGWYEVLERSERFQVKCLMVKPGGRLSLQSHFHRAEHWVVVSGTARVTVEDHVQLLTENQSTYIPIGARHRLENPGQIPALLIEVQSGSYLDEDDIVRYDDVYNRASDQLGTEEN